MTGGWKSIETAPKDKTEILVGRVAYGVFKQGVAYWSDDELWRLGGMTYFANPTHWQPLPEPPK